jgi:REP element-mobilizing transposase RayT
MPQSLSAIYLHLVFSTKNRVRFLQDTGLRSEMHRFLAGVCRELGCQALLVGGTEDHVHILGRLDRTGTVADWVKEAKRASTTWVRKRAPELRDFSWQAGYGAFSVSPPHVEPVRNYISQQQGHHAKTSFQDEFRNLIQKAGLELDERYMWD